MAAVNSTIAPVVSLSIVFKSVRSIIDVHTVYIPCVIPAYSNIKPTSPLGSQCPRSYMCSVFCFVMEWRLPSTATVFHDPSIWQFRSLLSYALANVWTLLASRSGIYLAAARRVSCRWKKSQFNVLRTGCIIHPPNHTLHHSRLIRRMYDNQLLQSPAIASVAVYKISYQVLQQRRMAMRSLSVSAF